MRPFFAWLPPKDGVWADAWPPPRYSSEPGLELVDFPAANLIRAFGGDWWDNWARMTRARLYHWGCNTVANWSEQKFCDWAGMPWVLPMSGFPTTGTRIFRDFPDVYAPEYADNARVFAAQLERYRDDRTLIGYFLSNEPHWAFVSELCIAEEVLKNPAPTHTKEALIAALTRQYGTAAALSSAWNHNFASFDELRAPIRGAAALSPQARADLEAFSSEMVRAFSRIPSEACRAAAPHHLNLGMRYAYLGNPALIAGCEFFDVFSVNCYQMDPLPRIRQAADLLAAQLGDERGRPILVGEFHFGALDAGLPSTGLRGVSSQAERGRAYRYYVEQAATHPAFVGAHYFTINDQGPLGRADGENYQIGMVDVCQQPYADFIDGVTAAHEAVLRVAEGLQVPTDRMAREIPSVAF